MTEPIDQEQTAAAAADNLPAQPADAPAIEQQPTEGLAAQIPATPITFTPNPEPADPKPTLIEIPAAEAPPATLVDGYVFAKPDYQQRVMDEKTELDDNRGRLLLFIGGPVFASLDEVDQNLLTRQAATMAAYSTILAARIARF